MPSMSDGNKHCTECGAGFETLIRIPAKVDLVGRNLQGPHEGDRGVPTFLKEGKFTLMWCKRCLFSWGTIPSYANEDQD